MVKYEKLLDRMGLDKGEETREETQYVNFSLKIYKADITPKIIDSCFMEHIKKKLDFEARDLLNPYVEVSFGGLKGRTSVIRRTMTPCWNEQLTFNFKFPIENHPVVVHLRDDEIMRNNIIGGTSISMDKISNPNKGGFLPTFGPCYVNLQNPDQSDVSFRGRLLLSITTEITTQPAREVTRESILPLPEGTCGQEVDFLLFACIRDATMIDRKVAEKPLRFSLQIGHFPECSSDAKTCAHRCDSNRKQSWINGFNIHESNQSHHCSSFVMPVTANRKWYNIPTNEKKECLWLISSWPDYRSRMNISNILDKATQDIESCLHSLYQYEDSKHSLKEAFEVLKGLECSTMHYITLLKKNWGFLSAKTQLDKERWKIYENKLETVKEIAALYKNGTDRSTIAVHLSKIEKLLQELKDVKDDPQPSLPDVVVWMENNQKRIGYFKIAARDLLYGVTDVERGVHCGKIRSLFLRPITKKKSAQYQAKLDIYLWLGMQKHFKHCLRALPQGFDSSDLEGGEIESIPRVIHYYEKQFYNLHAHLYQARFLPWTDMSTFPSPKAKLYISDRCLETQTCEDTLNPIWDETLMFKNMVFYGAKNEIVQNIPDVVIEIFSYNPTGKPTCLCRGIIPVTQNDSSPPVLKWLKINSIDSIETTQVLGAFELFSVPEDRGDTGIFENKFYDVGPIVPIPPLIRPRLSPHRIEVLFWGLRELKRVHFAQIEAPRIELECGGSIIESSIITNHKKHSNFNNMFEIVNMELPERDCYFPALTIRLLDCRSFGRRNVLASHVINRLQKYVVKPNGDLLEPKFEKTESEEGSAYDVIETPHFGQYIVEEVILTSQTFYSETIWTRDTNKRIPWTNSQSLTAEENGDDEDEEEVDWWSRYYISSMKTNQYRRFSTLHPRISIAGRESFDFPLHDTRPYDRRKSSAIPDFLITNEESDAATSNLYAESFVIYPCELENVTDFNGFKDWLHSFELTRGRRFSRFYRNAERIVAIFKGCFRIYETPLTLSSVVDPFLPASQNSESLFAGLPDNKPTKVLVRVYVVEAFDLAPSDVTNTADPYIVIQTENVKLSDQKNYVSKQLNPVFGKCFEILVHFPIETTLHIQVMDWDLVGADDLIGETKIDLENRFYSRHRPTCGLPRTYETSGPNAWRDVYSPAEILTNLCQENGLDPPLITKKDVRIANIRYDFTSNPQDDRISEENMILYLLHHWKDIAPRKYSVVPEHLETRTLYHPSKPGESRGKLVMWIDMFSEDSLPSSPPRNISKRKPVGYELRVIIWNTDEVVLADDAFLTGEKMSDIYVKGWLTGKEDAQKTDIHYRSLTGEGNFNWRFVFPFDYIPVERKMVVMKKVTVFSWDETESKLTPILKLQVFDADHFKSDDFLGEINLDLRHFPRGAKTVSSCSITQVKDDGTIPQVSLFKQKRMRGWWPVSVSTPDGEKHLTGKMEVELHLLKKEEAEESPVGLGRKEPDALPKPKRPATSFANFLHPWKTFRYAFWKRYKRSFIKVLIFVAAVLIILLFVYAAPGYIVKRLIGA